MKKILLSVVLTSLMVGIAYAAISPNQQYNSNIEAMINAMIARHNLVKADQAAIEATVAAYRAGLINAGVNWTVPLDWTNANIVGVNWSAYGVGTP